MKGDRRRAPEGLPAVAILSYSSFRQARNWASPLGSRSWIRLYMVTIGQMDGNIIAAIITTQAAT